MSNFKIRLEHQVRELFADSEKYLSQRNAVKLADRFIAEGRIKRPGEPIIVGHKAILESYRKLVRLDDLDITATNLIIEISEAGDMAVILSDYTNSYSEKGNRVTDSGIRILYLVRRDDQWRIKMEVLSSNGT